MRISEENINFIKVTCTGIFPGCRLFVFGSKVDDNAKGGDIDLLILSEDLLKQLDITKFRYQLLKKFGDRKIDILNYRTSDDNNFLSFILDEAVEI